MREGPSPSHSWVLMFAAARLGATLVAVLLLVFHRVTDYDALLAVLVAAYGGSTTALAVRSDRVARAPAFWAVDLAAMLALLLATADWRSPVYLLALTALVLPATVLAPRRGLAWTGAFTLGYLGVALVTGVDWSTLESSARLESFTAHLLLPVLVGTGLAYSSELLRRLNAEQQKSERLAVEQERRRLARELHDSAKQRIHAAQLVLSSLQLDPGATSDGIELALRELEAAAGEMESSLAGLMSPGWPADLVASLRGRAARLEAAAGIPVRVTGDQPWVSSTKAAHVFYVVSEAMINAVRHAGATYVEARLREENRRLFASVEDDGRGLPAGAGWNTHGLRSMVERAELLGGRLDVEARSAGPGTRVTLVVPFASREVSAVEGAS